MDIIVLGTGILLWPSHERISDRYGTVTLDSAPDGRGRTPAAFTDPPLGTHGRMVAVVLDTRHSPHCGDLVRGLRPRTPTVGDEVALGIGTLFTEDIGPVITEIGLRPDDDRAHDWLAPEALYRCHSQTVRLELRPSGHR
jgi:hypothetical protein